MNIATAGWMHMLDKARSASARNQIIASMPAQRSSPSILRDQAEKPTHVEINDKLDAENDRLTWAMEQIISRTNPDSCGLCDPQNLHDINQHAREALGRPTIVLENYYHDTKDGPADIRSYIAKALKSLSGDLSYDDVAAAKACLKEAIE